MYRLVESLEEVESVIDLCISDGHIGCDTETYGVEWLDRMFALQLATSHTTYYFNFHDYGDDTLCLFRPLVAARLARLFRTPGLMYYTHNAKFDLRRLALEGLKIAGGVHCTQMNERFIYNQYQHYSFDACLKRRGLEKDDAVEKYIKEHADVCISRVRLPNGETKTYKHYEKVPFPIMFKYGCADAERVRFLGRDQREKLEIHPFYHNDLELEKVAYEMEEIGIACDTDYAQKGLEHELEQSRLVSIELTALAGEPFRAGPNWLSGIFDRYGVPYRRHPKTGNPIFDKGALGDIDHPIAGLIRKHRRHEQYASTYYSYYSEHELVHAFIKLWGTDTGRFSYAEPNLQNVPKEEAPDPIKDPAAYSAWLSIPYPVRGCFRPRSTDHLFLMVDFDQQEFRLLLDYAGEMDLIRRINNEGEDVHQATADAVGVTRKQAKTLNFGLLYGMGAAKLAKALGCSLAEAQEIKRQYFAKLPKVAKLIEQIIAKSRGIGSIQTWCGRKLYTPAPSYIDGKRVTWDYKMPNHLIQGGCGDIARFAMVECHKRLAGLPNSNMLLQVHDELLFEIHKDDLDVVDDLVSIMENTYKPFNGMRMTCGIEMSHTSWAKKDIVPWAQNRNSNTELQLALTN